MNRCTTNEARKPPRIGSLAMISGALLGTIGAVGPALSADLPYSDTPYRSGYYRNWYHCDYYCQQGGPGDARVGAPGYEPLPPMAERLPPERHWAPRDYAEPRYPMGGPYSPYTQYRDRPFRSYRYSSPGPDWEANPYEGYEGPPDEPRRRMGEGGLPYPPAPAAYEYRPDRRRGPFRYGAMSSPPYDYREYRPPHQYRPAYEYETAERPPAPVPGGPYGPGYSE